MWCGLPFPRGDQPPLWFRGYLKVRVVPDSPEPYLVIEKDDPIRYRCEKIDLVGCLRENLLPFLVAWKGKEAENRFDHGFPDILYKRWRKSCHGPAKAQTEYQCINISGVKGLEPGNDLVMGKHHGAVPFMIRIKSLRKNEIFFGKDSQALRESASLSTPIPSMQRNDRDFWS